MNRFSKIFLACVFLLQGCAPTTILPGRISEHVNPAEEFSKAYNAGETDDYSIYRVADKQKEVKVRAKQQQQAQLHRVGGDPDLLNQGLNFKGSVIGPQTIQDNDLIQAPPAYQPANSRASAPSNYPPAPPRFPPGSAAPYHRGQLTSNPSLWPGSKSDAHLFRDFRAYAAMDIITILVDENQEGKKKAETETEKKFSLTAGITEFFGVETAKWAANNTSLDPTQLMVANTDQEFEGEGETTRSGSLKGKISAVVMEVLPNGLLRVEGTKIISVNAEEEVMVVSGLVRRRDIDSQNQVSSSRLANMRIDFYGRGLIADEQKPGWAARVINWVWPF